MFNFFLNCLNTVSVFMCLLSFGQKVQKKLNGILKEIFNEKGMKNIF